MLVVRRETCGFRSVPSPWFIIFIAPLLLAQKEGGGDIPFSKRGMDMSAIVVIAVFAGLCGLISICLGYKKYLAFIQRQKLFESRKQWKLKHRNTLTGNFVMTYHVPVEEDYTIKEEKILGKGSYGVVVVGIHKVSKVEYAIKFVSTESGKRNRIEREYKLLKDIDHPNIVRLFAVYDTDVSVRNF